MANNRSNQNGEDLDPQLFKEEFAINDTIEITELYRKYFTPIDFSVKSKDENSEIPKIISIQRETNRKVNETFNIIADALKEEEEVLIQNFGKFKVYDVKGYYGTNPKNRAEVIKINNHTKVAFTPGKELKEAVNDKPKNKKGYQPRK